MGRYCGDMVGREDRVDGVGDGEGYGRGEKRSIFLVFEGFYLGIEGR